MSYYWGSGLGATTGDSLVTTTTPLYTSGLVYWVNSATGDDANGGTERLRPLATLSAAVTAATDDDIIVLMAGHAESIGSQLNITERLTIVGEGSSGGVPTATLTRSANIVMFNITGTNVQLRGIKFAASTTSTSTNRIQAAGARFTMIGCYLESGANDLGPAVYISADNAIVESTTFISTATGTTSPYPMLYWDTVLTGLWIRSCIGDGGTVGFKHGSHVGSPVIDGVSGEVAALWIERLTLRNGADCFVFADGGYSNVYSPSGSSQVTI